MAAVWHREPTVWVLDEEEWVLADDQACDLYVISPEAVPTPEVIDIRAVTTTTSDILPGVTLTVEEVDAGVLRVVSDGVRDVEQVTMTAVDDDGTVWIDSAEGILELGRAGEHPSLVDGEGFLAVASRFGMAAGFRQAPEVAAAHYFLIVHYENFFCHEEQT